MTKRWEIKGTPWARTTKLTSGFTIGEAADLKVIADHWEVSVGTAIWAVIAEWLAVLRKRDLVGLPYQKSSKQIILRARELEAQCEKQGEGSEGEAGPEPSSLCPLCGHEYRDRTRDGAGQNREHAPIPPAEAVTILGRVGVGSLSRTGHAPEETGDV